MKTSNKVVIIVSIIVAVLFVIPAVMQFVVVPLVEHQQGYGMEERNPARCTALVAVQRRDDCFVVVAGNTQNPLLCEKIIDRAQQDACFENVASIMRSRSLCENIVDVTRQQQCLASVR